MNTLIRLLVILSMPTLALGQGYKISMRVEGLKDTVCYLGHYYGNKQYVMDTVNVDSEGRFVFEGEEDLPGGIYLAVMPGKQYFEFIVTEQKFSMSTTKANVVKNMTVKDSYENERFYKYLKFMVEKQKEIDPIKKDLEKAKEDGKSTKKLESQLKKINEEVQQYKLDEIKNHPNAFISKVFIASRDVEVPDPPKDKSGQIDSTWRYRYYKEHYLDNIDFSDDRLLRTPIFHEKLETYITKITMQMPDSIIKEADRLVARARANNEVFKYVVHFITNHYERSKYMGMDAVFVHMALNYYNKEDAFWVSDAQLVKIKDRATTLNRLLIGKVAPNILMKDLDGKYETLHEVDAKYTLLVFWDPDCGHCKKAMPKIKATYEKFKGDGLKIFAVCTETEEEKWKNYIEEKGLMEWTHVADLELKNPFRAVYDISATPKLFLLDEKKVIIAKQLDAEQLDEFLMNLLKKKDQ
ncbi:MAG: DUF5106 domain-containing protein [Flavobacteriales bacterium]|nr:DUF5106 domain-containing protein [Flavobacteriales bacterium]